MMVFFPSILIDFFDVQEISWNRCYEPWIIKRDKKLKIYLSEKIKVNSFNGSLLWEPWEILKSDKIKIINFWASWCLPCEVEHPILMGLSKKSDFIIIGVNYKDTDEGSAKFLNEKGNPYDLVVIDDEGMMGIEMGLTGVPETFVVNEEGKIIYRIVGPINNENKF